MNLEHTHDVLGDHSILLCCCSVVMLSEAIHDRNCSVFGKEATRHNAVVVWYLRKVVEVDSGSNHRDYLGPVCDIGHP